MACATASTVINCPPQRVGSVRNTAQTDSPSNVQIPSANPRARFALQRVKISLMRNVLSAVVTALTWIRDNFFANGADLELLYATSFNNGDVCSVFPLLIINFP